MVQAQAEMDCVHLAMEKVLYEKITNGDAAGLFYDCSRIL